MTKAATGARSGAKSDAAVVLFLGDATVVDPLVHALVDERMESSSQSLDFEIFRFGESPLEGIEGAMRQVGMFSTKRCVWLRGLVETRKKPGAGDKEGKSDEKKEKAKGTDDGDGDEDEESEEESGSSEQLLELLTGGIPPGTLFVVSSPALDARGKLFKWFSKNAEVRDRRVQVEHTGQRRGKLSEQGLRAAIEQRLAELGVTRLGPGALDEVIRRSGNALGETMQEIDRVVLAQADPTQLTAAGVTSAMRDLALGWVFDFTVALEGRNLGAAEALIARLLAEGEPPLRLTALLASQFASLVAARPFVESLPRDWQRMRGTDFLAGPGASLPDFLKGWPGYFRLKAASNFSYDELRRLHGEVRRLDLALKSSPTDPLLLFSRLLQSACIGGPAR